jgi:hypothetical protein
MDGQKHPWTLSSAHQTWKADVLTFDHLSFGLAHTEMHTPQMLAGGGQQLLQDRVSMAFVLRVAQEPAGILTGFGP